jgi:heme oxygenase
VTGSAPASVISVLDLVKERTRDLHTRAERTGIMRDLLRGHASRAGYILLLRNLLPVYQALEDGLARHAGTELIGPLAAFRLARGEAIAGDLAAFGAHDLPLLPSARAYAERVSAAAQGDGVRLIAHAYTRYLGDLSGGQILRRLLGQSLGLGGSQLNFYDFGNVGGADLKEIYQIGRAHV